MPCSAVMDCFGVGDGFVEGGGSSYVVDGSLLVLEALPGVFACGVFMGGGVVDGVVGSLVGELDFGLVTTFGGSVGVLFTVGRVVGFLGGLGLGTICGGSVGENCVEAARTRSLRAGDFDICGVLNWRDHKLNDKSYDILSKHI